ncbi:40S ribosomal protein S15-like [Portunus trituberculatus]|uniref:40S ribosomal protein S15-like n=1 Tax=Portunus trituberculatus TaxID=210409 RepID=UPI001E1CFFE3|nr:40S ribosomal protein S15-like [Portunus trituberculatus]
MADTLEPRGTLTLYKAQIRPCMEYGALSWMSSATVHMQRLDAVQRRALRLPHTAQRCTRDAARSDELVQVPRSRSSQHQRTYTARTSRLWNIFVATHKWRGRHPSRLVRFWNAKECPAMEKPAVVKILCDMIIVPEMVGSMVGVYNDKTFNQD